MTHPRLLTPAENAAITAQCIRRVYDEHDREDSGREITTTEKGETCRTTPQT